MDLQETIEKLDGFKEKGGNWVIMSDLIRDVTLSDAWVGHYKSNADWLKAAAQMSGYQPTVIRRMLRVRNFLDKMIENKKLSLPKDGTLPLASLEIIERLYPLAPDTAFELLVRAVEGKVTLREVDKIYSSLLSNNHQVVRIMNASVFKDLADQAVRNNINVFAGYKYNHLLSNHKTSLISNIDLVGVRIISSHALDDDIKEYDGFSFMFFNNYESFESNRYRALHLIAYNSNFFNRYWFILSASSGDDAARWLRDALVSLCLYNVGIAVLPVSAEAEVSESDKWYFPGSIIRPHIKSPHNPDFFPTKNEYTPKWLDLLSIHL